MALALVREPEHATGSGTVQLWKLLETGEPRVLTWHTNVAGRCAFSLDGRCSPPAPSMERYNCGGCRTAPNKRSSPGTHNAYETVPSPDGTLLATASDDRTVRLRDLSDGIEKAVLTGHLSWERCAFSPDGILLATTSRDGTVRLGHHDPHLPLRAPRRRPLLGIAWHPTGTLLCTTGGAGTYMLTYLP